MDFKVKWGAIIENNMIIKIVSFEMPVHTIAYVKSTIEWGNSMEDNLQFELDVDIVKLAYQSTFKWAEGKNINEVTDYIANKEKEKIGYRKSIKQNYLTRKQKHELMWQEEQKKIAIWRDEHLVCGERGEVYFL